MSEECRHEWAHIRRIHIANADGQGVTHYDVYYCVWCLAYQRTEVPPGIQDQWKAVK